MSNFSYAIHRLIDQADGWWSNAARWCYYQGNYEAIPSRDGKGLYLLRFWLSMPILRRRPGKEDRFESCNSVLLHCFNQPDDDGAPHDHPWRFTTEVLQGGYDEEYLRYNRARECWDGRVHKLDIGSVATREATVIHAVVRLYGPTWTLVQTGEHVRDWGFWPKPGHFVPWQQYLAEKLAASNG